MAVLEHFTWGGKGGARGHARVAWEGGQYVVFYTVYITCLLLSHALTQVLGYLNNKCVCSECGLSALVFYPHVGYTPPPQCRSEGGEEPGSTEWSWLCLRAGRRGRVYQTLTRLQPPLHLKRAFSCKISW